MSTIDRRNISTETVFEQRNGYSRIVRVGPHAWSAGTLAIDENGDIVHSNSHYQQTLFALEKIETALNEAGVKEFARLARAHFSAPLSFGAIRMGNMAEFEAQMLGPKGSLIRMRSDMW